MKSTIALLAATSLSLCQTVPAATLMVLADWYDPSFDSLVRVDSVWIPGYSTSPSNGYVRSGRNQLLVPTKGYAGPLAILDTSDPSAPVVRRMERRWFSIPDYDPGLYVGQIMEIRAKYLLARHVSDKAGHILQIDTANGLGQTAELNRRGELENCVDSLASDTIWIRAVAAERSAYASTFSCSSSNPFLESHAVVHFFPPFPATHVQSIQNGHATSMVADARWPGWYRAPISDSLGAPWNVALTFTGKDAAGATKTWDSLGHPWQAASDSGASFWILGKADGTASAVRRDSVPGAAAIVLGFPSGERVGLQADQGGFPGVSLVAGWSVQPLWSRPASVYEIHSDGSRSGGIDILSQGDTVWLSGGPVAGNSNQPDVIWLSMAAFDFDKTYNPFAEAGPGDDCPQSGGSETQGLVGKALGSNGFPVWTGWETCDIGGPMDSPQYWFRDTFAVASTTIRLPLSRPVDSSNWSYSNLAFFPLDTVVAWAPVKDHNFGFCTHTQFQTMNVPGGVISIRGDDDIWLFGDDTLRIDLGGQHGPVSGRYNFSRFPQAEGAVIDFDLFQCERHAVGSDLTISSNIRIFPGRTLAKPAILPAKVRDADHPVRLRVLSGRKIAVDVPSGRSWTVSARSLDGAVRFRTAGTGSGTLSLPGAHGACVILLRSEGRSDSRQVAF